MALSDLPTPGALRERSPLREETKVLRRLAPFVETPLSDARGSDTRVALVVDTETTGLEPDAEIVELAIRPISYRVADGAVVGTHPAYVGLQEPRAPLSPEVSALVGLSDEDLRGCSIDLDVVDNLVRSSALVIAHSARFDRPHLERLCPLFATKPWACSIEDADWAGEKIESSKLAYVAAFAAGFFFDAHRALDDVDAVVEILGREAKGGGTIFDKILASARAGRHRVSVIAAYETRHALKARGYRWDAGDGALRPKCWFKDLTNFDAVESERAALELICDRDAVVTAGQLSAVDRFSERA